MTIGPEPIIRIFLMSVRFGIFLPCHPEPLLALAVRDLLFSLSVFRSRSVDSIPPS
jgi:hypothetical protein